MVGEPAAVASRRNEPSGPAPGNDHVRAESFRQPSDVVIGHVRSDVEHVRPAASGRMEIQFEIAGFDEVLEQRMGHAFGARQIRCARERPVEVPIVDGQIPFLGDEGRDVQHRNANERAA
jgi:hypothetical protein